MLTLAADVSFVARLATVITAKRRSILILISIAIVLFILITTRTLVRGVRTIIWQSNMSKFAIGPPA